MKTTLRRRFVVCYDIREPRRLRKTHETMLGYGDPMQYSVFICDLSRSELLVMEDALRNVVDSAVDAVHIVDLGPAAGIARGRIRVLCGSTMPAPTRHQVL